jgi:hypothetical protein
MGEYIRSTREVSLSSLDPALLSVIQSHVEKYELGDFHTSVLMCCETTSTKQKQGLLGGKTETILAGVILTAQWLIWATRKDNDSPSVVSARLRDIQVQDYEKSEMHKLIQDTGINLSGLRTDAMDVGSTFIGLGTEAAADKFRAILKEAIAKA